MASAAGPLRMPTTPRERHVVAVDHLGAAGEAEERLDLAAVAAGDAFGVGGVVGDEAAADLLAVHADDVDRVAALEAALDPADARRQEALARPERPRRAFVDDQRAARLQPARDPGLARGHRIGFGQEPGAALAGGDPLERVRPRGRWR